MIMLRRATTVRKHERRTHNLITPVAGEDEAEAIEEAMQRVL